MDRNAGFDPADQFIAPGTEQLAKGGKLRHGRRPERCEALAQKVEGIALEVVTPAVAPLPPGRLAPAGKGPEGVAYHHTPAAEPLAALHRFQQHPLASAGTHLQPGAQGRFQVGGPPFRQGNEGVAAKGLSTAGSFGEKGVAVGGWIGIRHQGRRQAKKTGLSAPQL